MTTNTNTADIQAPSPASTTTHAASPLRPVMWYDAVDPDAWRPSTVEERAATKARHAELAAEWKAHRSYNTTIARHFVEDVHRWFRQSFRSILRSAQDAAGAAAAEEAASGKPQPKARVNLGEFRRMLDNLEGHHHAEDAHFPHLTKAGHSPASHARGYQYLTLDHRHLDPLERQVLRDPTDLAAMEEFVSFLEDHLNREEMLLVPVLLAGRFRF